MYLPAAFRGSFLWKFVPAAILVGFGDWIFYQQHLHGGYLGLFALLLLALLFAGRPVMMRERRAWAPAAAALLFSVALIYDASLLGVFLFWVAASVAALVPATARFDDGWRWFQRLLWHGLRTPFAPAADLMRLLKFRQARGGGRRSLATALPVLVLPLTGSAVILGLFAAANPVIERLLAAIALPELSPATVLRLILWALLLILAWSLLRPRLPRRLLPVVPGGGALVLPGVSVASVTLSLLAFNVLFALQNLLDVAYLWGLLAMPKGMTMADYAHRGAYPLVATALLAALFVLLTLRPGSATARTAAIRRLVTLWIAQNIFLVASSILRMMDYVDAYSLTRLRIAALAWMVLVGFGLGAICWRLLRERSAAWLINVNLAAAGLVLTLASFIDLGAVAARWNVSHARETGGRGVALDLCYLGELGGSALLSLISLEQRPGLHPALRERVGAVRQRVHAALVEEQREGWTLLGQRRLELAASLLARQPVVALKPGARNCNGALLPPSVGPAAPGTSPPRALTGEGGK